MSRNKLIAARAATPAVAFLAAALPPAAGAAGQATGAPAGPPRDSIAANPFAGFETRHLANGLKVWFKHLPGAPNVSVSAGVPVGSDADPPGREQLAHLTEHMLLSDHAGRTEQEIKDAVEGLGGERNGLTFPDHTWFYVNIPREHGLFAIEWLAGIMSPHAMDPDVVERGRQPVQNEVRARPRQLVDHLLAVLNPAWLTPPRFWEREFGIENRRDPFPNIWKSLGRITPGDLRGFYDRYYAPGAMTVTIVGDLDRDRALATAQRTFGALPARTVHRWAVSLADPGRRKTAFAWNLRATVQYESRHKLFDPSARDLLAALFVRDLLNRRLNQRLRFGERKAAYAVSAALVTRGPAAYLSLRSRIDRDDYNFARGVIDEEIDQLRRGSLDPELFEADRAAVVERLRASNQTAESLNVWTRNYFYEPGVFTDFPDVLSFYRSLTQEQAASLAEKIFDPSRQVLTVTRPRPVSQGVLVALLAALAWVTLRLLARLLTRPIRMKGLRYVGRFRVPVVLRAAYAAAATAAVLVVARLTFAGYRWSASRWIEGIDHYGVQAAGGAGALVLLLVASSVIVASAPRRILLFDDHVRIKSRAWLSRILKAEDIAEISVRRFRSIWLTRALLGGPPLAFGLVRPGIYIKPVTGRSYFFRSRDTEELAQVLTEWWVEGVEPDTRE